MKRKQGKHQNLLRWLKGLRNAEKLGRTKQMGNVKGTMWDEKCTLGPGGEGPQIPWERGPALRYSSWEPVGTVKSCYLVHVLPVPL